jgi:hypothetical protein
MLSFHLLLIGKLCVHFDSLIFIDLRVTLGCDVRQAHHVQWRQILKWPIQLAMFSDFGFSFGILQDVFDRNQLFIY